ncbi:MAG: DegT/DnrJ/EryC1/StrS aminotransferase family protein [Candidatus Omnitrophota bacterium]
MPAFHEIPPTAGFPLYLKDYLALFSRQARSSCLEEDFKDYLGTPFTRITYSGTAAFYFILETLKKLSPRKTVVIPSFICPLVPLAIKRAGLKIAVCDTRSDNFNFDINALEKNCTDNKDLLAIVATHLGGIPLEIETIKRVAEKNNIFIIEDCAQSLGARYKGKLTGTIGDFSFFSLCRGKGLTIYEGGVLTAKKELYCKEIDDIITQFSGVNIPSETLKILELFGYGIFYRPCLFWFAYRLPQIYWEARKEPLKALAEYFDTDFDTHRVSKLRKNIGHITFARLEEEIKKQRQKAAMYIEGLQGSGIKVISEAPGDYATYPYLTLIFPEEELRRKAIKTFRDSGLGVSQIYAHAICDYDYLGELTGNAACPNARSLAKTHITLSTSTFMTNKDIDRVINTIRKL